MHCLLMVVIFLCIAPAAGCAVELDFGGWLVALRRWGSFGDGVGVEIGGGGGGVEGEGEEGEGEQCRFIVSREGQNISGFK